MKKVILVLGIYFLFSNISYSQSNLTSERVNKSPEVPVIMVIPANWQIDGILDRNSKLNIKKNIPITDSLIFNDFEVINTLKVTDSILSAFGFLTADFMKPYLEIRKSANDFKNADGRKIAKKVNADVILSINLYWGDLGGAKNPIPSNQMQINWTLKLTDTSGFTMARNSNYSDSWGRIIKQNEKLNYNEFILKLPTIIIDMFKHLNIEWNKTNQKVDQFVKTKYKSKNIKSLKNIYFEKYGNKIQTVSKNGLKKFILKDKIDLGDGYFLVDGKEWLIQDLNSNKFNDGSVIPQVEFNESLLKSNSSKKEPLMAYIDERNPSLGAVYNFYAIEKGISTPYGYKIAEEKDWDELQTYVATSNSFNISDFEDFTRKNDFSKRNLIHDYWANTSKNYQDAVGHYYNFGSSFYDIIDNNKPKIYRRYYPHEKYQYDGDLKGSPKSEMKLVKCIKDQINEMRTYIFNNGDSIFGEYERSIGFNGKTISKDHLGEIIIGDFLKGSPNGLCTLIDQNGNSYTGQFVNWKKEGLFTLTDIYGDSKQIYFHKGLKFKEEGENGFKELLNMSSLTRDLAFINNGYFLSSLKSSNFKGGSTGTTQISGIFNIKDGEISICNLGLIANNKFYNNTNCLTLSTVTENDNKVILGFSGSVTLNQEHYTISSKINPNGKIEKNIERTGSSGVEKNVDLQIRIDKYGNFDGFQFCIIDSNGNPDCGAMSTPYRGSLYKN